MTVLQYWAGPPGLGQLNLSLASKILTALNTDMDIFLANGVLVLIAKMKMQIYFYFPQNNSAWKRVDTNEIPVATLLHSQVGAR